MSRATTIRLGLLLTALLLPVAGAEAAGRRGGSFTEAPRAAGPTGFSTHHRTMPAAETRHAGIRHVGTHHPGTRFAGSRDDGGRHWRRGGRGLFTSAGYLGPWSYPAGSGGGQAVASDGDASQGWVDRNSFENMPVRMGIMRSPTPEPTIYRLEGRRDRPATRVIRINDPEPQGRRSRFAHAETGALLLTVPRH